MISFRRVSLSAAGGIAITMILLRSLAIVPLDESRHWPLASKTVKPEGKRGVTSSARKRAHFASLTWSRPNSRSATIQGFCVPEHCSCCASAAAKLAARASTPTMAARASKALPADPFDRGAAGGELVFEPLEAAVEMIDAVHHGLAFGSKRGDDERHRGAEIGRHHRGAF